MRHILRHASLTLAALGLCTACAMGPQPTNYSSHAEYMAAHGLVPTEAPAPTSRNPAQDHLECLALASQGAQGYGAFFSSRILREALYNDQKQKLYTLCAQSRGYPD